MGVNLYQDETAGPDPCLLSLMIYASPSDFRYCEPGHYSMILILHLYAAMNVTVNLNVEELADFKRLTALEDSTAAVTKAAREFLRLVQLRQLKDASGKVDYEDAP
jgi:hypothetical protein